MSVQNVNCGILCLFQSIAIDIRTKEGQELIQKVMSWSYGSWIYN